MIVWELLCDCGNTTYVGGSSVATGNTKSCGCAVKRHAVAQGHKNREYNPMISSARSVWYRYRDCGCDFETFLALSQKECFYCGRLPYRVFNLAKQRKGNYDQVEQGNFTYNGLDRLDSDKGHELDNIVPCCFECNTAKLTMTKEQFLSLVNLIYNKHLRN